MKFYVAYPLRVSLSSLITTALLVSVMSAQTTNRGSARRTANKARGEAEPKPRNDTLKICQGVPIPTGYVVVAYLTSETCPHGVYVLKKQDPYSESVAQRYLKPKQSTTNTSMDSGVSTTGDSKQSTSSAASQAESDASQQIGSRPRRVSSSPAPHEVAVVADDEPERPARPPRWAGTPPTGSPVAATSGAVADPGPEEVGEGDVVRVNTSLVTVPVSVSDRNGRFIADLQREDFTVFENGVEQQIAYWEPAEKPFTVALLLDTSPSTQFHLWQIKEAAIAFAKQLRPQDRVLIVSFNDQVLLLTEVTNDMNLISAVINQNAQMGNATRVYDAVHLVIKEQLNKIKGRKAIVLFTDGVDTASYQANYASTMREVDELDALIYPIQYDTTDYLRAMQGAGAGSVTVVTTTYGPFGTRTSRVTHGAAGTAHGQPMPGTTQADYDRANRYLHELADKTAGRLYRANDTTQLANAFSQIAEELRRQYSLGYYPQDGNTSAERRQIKVRVNRPNLAVKARDSYTRTTPPGRQ